MNMKQNKVVNFVRDHKEKLVLGACVLGGGISLIVFGKNCREAKMLESVLSKLPKDIKVDGWDTGRLDQCWTENGYINAIVRDLTLADAGKLGETLMKIDGVTSDSSFDIVLGVLDNRVG